MLASLIKIIDPNTREVKRLRKMTAKVTALEPTVASLSDAELAAKTDGFRKRLQEGEPLDNLLFEAFAVAREAAKRVTGMRPFDVQIMGAIVLHEGRIAEMKTGEGKTLVAVMPLFLNALEGRGAFLVTVNDYLARRDCLWMGPIYHALGLSVGCIQHGRDLESYRLVKSEEGFSLEPCSRKEAYACDITYGTNNEFGFDYLRDNMATSIDEVVQRELHYCIVDEVDSILIDEARTPLIISGIAEKPTELYYRFARLLPKLKKDEDFTVDEKESACSFTEYGIEKLERELGVKNLMDPENIELLHHAHSALRAHSMMRRDVDYVVKEGKVIIVDEFTGRLMYGRRFSEGLHQAIEAKEGVKIEHESQTLASITFQNLFRLFHKMGGMTGTAKTEEGEFRKIYGTDVVVVPTHKTMIRQDAQDIIYKTEDGKYQAIVNDILEKHRQGRPVLVGTRSIEKSEKLSQLLHKQGILRVDWKKYSEEDLEKLTNCHFILNAKEHEHEAKVIARAGRRGAVTIATNMAGRGVDIVLEENLAALGGLHVIGSERHESRRIDNQLRGRSGRQGDPGSSQFYVSLDDELMRIFGGERVKQWMERFGFTDETPIDHPWLSKQIENAQKKVESMHFEARKYVLEYDDVMETQRKTVYTQRRKILEGASVKDNILEFAENIIEQLVAAHTPQDLSSDHWDLEKIVKSFYELFPAEGTISVEELKGKDREEIVEHLAQKSRQLFEEREALLTSDAMRDLERRVFLHVLDRLWIEHLDAMDHLRDGIGLRAYGQIDPVVAYKKEAFEMFQDFLSQVRHDVVTLIYRVQAFHAQENLYRPQEYVHGEAADRSQSPQPVAVQKEKIPRNAPCPCGSGKKYKKCCGQAA